MARARRVRGQVVGKYNAKGEHVEIDGKRVWIASAGQAERARQLMAMREAGVIDNLRLEVPVILTVNNMKICTYRVDAMYEVIDERGAPVRLVYEEVKGLPTADWKLKRKLFDATQGTKLSIVQLPGGKVSSVDWMRENWAGRLPV